MRSHMCVLLVLATLQAISATARCEDFQPLPSTLTLEDAVKYALARQPSSRAARAIEAGEEAGLKYARTNYLPQLDLSAQETRATANNVPGLYLLTPGFPQLKRTKTAASSERTHGTARPPCSCRRMWPACCERWLWLMWLWPSASGPWPDWPRTS
jgi:outer membrane protein TolC